MDKYEAFDKLVELFPFKSYIKSKNQSLETGSLHDTAYIASKYLNRGAKILDFGSGACDKSGLLQLMGYQCSATDDLNDDWHLVGDNRTKIMEFAHKIGIDFTLSDDGPFEYEENYFDMVMIHHVLEHLHDSPKNLLLNLLNSTKDAGLIFITVPSAVNIRKRIDVVLGRTNLPRFESYYWYPGKWRGHVREYVKQDLQLLASYLDLEILELRGCDHMISKLPKYQRSSYLLLTGIFPSLKDSWLMIAKKRSHWNPKFELSSSDRNVILEKSTSYKYEK